MAGGVINTALSCIFVGPGLTLSGSTLSATPGTGVKAYRTVGGSTSLTSDDYYVGYTGGAGSTFTMPAASTNGGVELVIKNRGTAALTLDATGLGMFYGTSLVNTWSLAAGEGVHVISDGTNWIIVSFASGIITP